MIVLERHEKKKINCAVFDFDGTISTLRCGWESVMEPLMLEYIFGEDYTEENVKEVRDYIAASTGIQTILQMKWLAERVKKEGKACLDPWEYKAEYNRRLMINVEKRCADTVSGNSDKYIMRGSKQFLEALKERGVRIFAASGTDEADVKHEAAILGIDAYFDEIAGAKPHSEDCSKEATLNRLISQGQGGLLVVGDGPVEIRLGKAAGACTLGICGKERDLCGIDDVKVNRLTNAGAHALVDCFDKVDEILAWMED
ncbi:MAG: HAD family hydrolase [Ruminococcaceae bacterium]|nr:HAD family hydrolase [Oscillospiraceae bacterium]